MNAIHEGVRRKSAKNNGVRSTDTRTGQHGDGKLGSHAHVDRDAVAFVYAQRFQHIGELLHLAMQLLKGERPNFAGFTFPDDGGFVLARGLDVAVEAVVGEIQLAANKPLCPGMVPFENFVPFLKPVQFFGNSSPEFFGLLD